MIPNIDIWRAEGDTRRRCHSVTSSIVTWRESLLLGQKFAIQQRRQFMKSTTVLLAFAALVLLPGCAAQGDKVSRGYFGLHDHDRVVHVTSTADFMVCIWARNVETTGGGVQIVTPASQFRGPGSTGPIDGLVLNVPPQTGVDLGCLGGRANETIDISDVGARVTVFLSVRSAPNASISMTRE